MGSRGSKFGLRGLTPSTPLLTCSLVQANEDFLATFEKAYSLIEQRIGAPSSVSPFPLVPSSLPFHSTQHLPLPPLLSQMRAQVNLARGGRYEDGGVLRVQRCFPGPFEVHVMSPDGISQAIGAFEASAGRPTYNQLDELITKGRKAGMEIFGVARKASTLAIEVRRGTALSSIPFPHLL
jgi:hypothetical protein